MIIAIDFDGTIIDDTHQYDDLATPLKFLPGALRALHALRRAGHTLILYSGRANRALREDWRLNPLWLSHAVPFDVDRWARNLPLNRARYKQMVDFVETELPGVFSAIDDGHQGKVSADLYIDDRALKYGPNNWGAIAEAYGEHQP